MIVCGLDGLAWTTLDEYFLPEELPTLFDIYHTWNVAELPIEGPPHSAPSWTTIFTGVPWQQHNIRNFENPLTGKRYVPSDINAPLVWERIGSDAAAFSIYNMLPPITYNCKFDEDMEFSLTLQRNEMQTAVIAQVEKAIALTQEGKRFVAFVNIALDKAHHMSSKYGMGNIAGARDMYEFVDAAVYMLLYHLGDEHIVFLSDHGLPSKAYEYPDGVRIPGHHPMGIFATNRQGFLLPQDSMQVADWLLEHYNGKPMQVQRNRDMPAVTPDQEAAIEEHLRELGYIE